MSMYNDPVFCMACEYLAEYLKFRDFTGDKRKCQMLFLERIGEDAYQHKRELIKVSGMAREMENKTSKGEAITISLLQRIERLVEAYPGLFITPDNLQDIMKQVYQMNSVLRSRYLIVSEKGSLKLEQFSFKANNFPVLNGDILTLQKMYFPVSTRIITSS